MLKDASVLALFAFVVSSFTSLLFSRTVFTGVLVCQHDGVLDFPVRLRGRPGRVAAPRGLQHLLRPSEAHLLQGACVCVL